MVLAIEPLYLIQGEGYQVEDELIITENGYELITNYRDPSELLTVPTA
jgi:Xaa-Pro aminopeptidase